jgi:hypothetical protein
MLSGAYSWDVCYCSYSSHKVKSSRCSLAKSRGTRKLKRWQATFVQGALKSNAAGIHVQLTKKTLREREKRKGVVAVRWEGALGRRRLGQLYERTGSTQKQHDLSNTLEGRLRHVKCRSRVLRFVCVLVALSSMVSFLLPSIIKSNGWG